MAEYRSPQTEPGNEQRFLLVILVMAAVIFGAQFLLRKNAPAPAPDNSKQAQQQTSAAPATASAPATAASATQTAPASAKASKQAAAIKQAEAETETVIENELYRITFTNRGAQAKSWLLKDYKDDQGKPLDLVNQPAAAKFGYPLSLWTYDEALRNKLNSALFVASSSGTVNAPTKLEFEYSESGLTVRKTLEFDNTYVVHVSTSVFQNDAPVYAFPAWPAGFGDQTSLAAYASIQFEYQANQNDDHIAPKKVSGGNTLHGFYNWIGVSTSYFGAVFIPDDPDNLTAVTLHSPMEFLADPNKPNDKTSVSILGVAVGHPGETSARLFAGPKAFNVLDSVPVPSIVGADKDLRKVVNLGWFSPIARPLFSWPYIGLRWYHQYVHSWGWAIVIQTFIITILLLPLRIYQMKSAFKMQRIQPQMKAIQEKYKKYSMRDPRKQDMQKEMGELYKEHGVNPVSGCLPLLVQMPFFIAYYKMLSALIELRQAHWLWIHDLSSSDFVLPLLMAGSMFLVQKMTPQAGMDPAQQKMMTVMMPVMMGFLFFRLPAGLNLYYAESNIISIVQQWIMNRTKLGREIREINAKRAKKKDSR
jgi:YidC/Oxa1 family membrane protein insertase